MTTLEFEHGSSTTVLESEQAVRTVAARCRCGSCAEEDAYRYVQHLDTQGSLLPTDDDDLRDGTEAAVRLQRGLTVELLGLIDRALATPGTECRQDLSDWLPVEDSSAQLPTGHFLPTSQLLSGSTLALTKR